MFLQHIARQLSWDFRFACNELFQDLKTFEVVIGYLRIWITQFLFSLSATCFVLRFSGIYISLPRRFSKVKILTGSDMFVEGPIAYRIWLKIGYHHQLNIEPWRNQRQMSIIIIFFFQNAGCNLTRHAVSCVMNPLDFHLLRFSHSYIRSYWWKQKYFNFR